MFGTLQSPASTAYESAAVDYSGGQPSLDPGADTMPTNCSMSKTAPPANNVEWRVTTVASLSQVEDLLDSLEAHGIAHREVLAIGNNVFAVRWR